MLHEHTLAPDLSTPDPAIMNAHLAPPCLPLSAPAPAGLVCSSHFQPIYSLAHRRLIGVEGLLRAHNPQGQPVPPAELFAPHIPLNQRTALDRHARALHVAHYARLGLNNSWLFLNADAEGFLLDPQAVDRFPDWLAAHGLTPDCVVLEVLEHRIDDLDALVAALQQLKQQGCVIAVDDFGAGHANIDRLWRLEPDIVKLDRSLLRDASQTRQARALYPRLVAMLQEIGALVVAEGVETEREGVIALESQADFVQGYYFARPAPQLPDSLQVLPVLDTLWHDFEVREQARRQNAAAVYRSVHAAFRQCANALAAGIPLVEASIMLRQHPDVLRCFLLNQFGEQVGDNIGAYSASSLRRFAPLADAKGARWSRRPYFRSALEQPGRVQLTQPYLSVTEPVSCVTMSLALEVHERVHVLCTDLHWHERVSLPPA